MLPFALVVLPLAATAVFLLVTLVPARVLKTILEFVKQPDLISQSESKRLKEAAGLSYLPLILRT